MLPFSLIIGENFRWNLILLGSSRYNCFDKCLISPFPMCLINHILASCLASNSFHHFKETTVFCGEIKRCSFCIFKLTCSCRFSTKLCLIFSLNDIQHEGNFIAISASTYDYAQRRRVVRVDTYYLNNSKSRNRMKILQYLFRSQFPRKIFHHYCAYKRRNV